MQKLLEKEIKDARKEKKSIWGTKQVLNSVNKSKLIVTSYSISKDELEIIHNNAKKGNVNILNFDGSSVDLGKLCGLQFRVSAMSFTSISEANIKSIMKESKQSTDGKTPPKETS